MNVPTGIFEVTLSQCQSIKCYNIKSTVPDININHILESNIKNTIYVGLMKNKKLQ